MWGYYQYYYGVYYDFDIICGGNLVIFSITAFDGFGDILQPFKQFLSHKWYIV